MKQPREKLIEALKSSRLSVLAGAGVSAAITQNEPTATWMGLLHDGIERAIDVNETQASLLQMRLEANPTTDEVARIAETLTETLGEKYPSWITRTIADLQVKDDSLAKAIGGLDVPIFTTNYDKLLEKSLNRRAVTWTNASQFRDSVTTRSTDICHLHGVYDDYESIILTDKDYRRVLDNEAAQNLQTSIFTTTSFLFIGVGDGANDPNFSPMIRKFSEHFKTTQFPHFRLCTDSDRNSAGDLGAIIDVPYGESHNDLPAFLNSLADELSSGDSGLISRSRIAILESLRDNSTLWRDQDELNTKQFSDLVIPPTFLPEPHNEYARSHYTPESKKKRSPIDIEAKIKGGGIILVAGDAQSGVSTGIQYILHQSMDILKGTHAIFLPRIASTGSSPVERAITRQYNQMGIDASALSLSDRLVLGIDSLVYDESKRFRKIVDNINKLNTALTVIGIDQSDAVNIARELKQHHETITITYLGRFSDLEAMQLASRLGTFQSEDIAKNALSIAKEKNLPRTPFTLTLLIELVQSGISLENENSELSVLDQYVSELLSFDFPKIDNPSRLSVRNKRKILEHVAMEFVKVKADEASYSEVLKWVEDLYENLGWTVEPAERSIRDLIRRRLLSSTDDSKIRFQRSAYLELMAGIAASKERDFRSLVFAAPIQLASIVRSYAAMARNDHEVIELVLEELNRIKVRASPGYLFEKVRRTDADDSLFQSEPLVYGHPNQFDPEGNDDTENVSRDGMTGHYYDDTPDADSPAFLTAHLDDLPESRVAMLVVDLSSRVIRESDEISNQAFKAEALLKILTAWLAFLDIYGEDLKGSEDLDPIVEEMFENHDRELTDSNRSQMRRVLEQIVPMILLESGLDMCLASPTLIKLLSEMDFSDSVNAYALDCIRTLALMHCGGSAWVESLIALKDESIDSVFCASFVFGIVRARYIQDSQLSDSTKRDLRNFLKRVLTRRFRFKSSQHRNSSIDSFMTSLEKERLTFLTMSKNDPELR